MKTKVTTLLALILTSFLTLNAQFIGTSLGEHSIVIRSDGKVYAWGSHSSGALGTGPGVGTYNTPQAVKTDGVLSGKTITKIAGGFAFSISLDSDGKVYTWGSNVSGQLGNGNTGTDRNVPVAVSTSGVLSGKTITQVAAGGYHSVALDSDGKVYTWGYNLYGELGNSNNTDSNLPVAVITSGALNGKTITKIAAGRYHSLALASDGTVYGWGNHQNGQLGMGSGNNTYNVPVAVKIDGVLSGKTITQIAAGYNHSIALDSDGKVYTWGDNTRGQLGIGSYSASYEPVEVYTGGVLSGKTIIQIAAGAEHSIALASDGTVYTWGRNTNGQLGNSSYTLSTLPVAVNTSGVLSGKTITQVGGGNTHSIVFASDGSIYTWGYNDYGQLGNSSYTTSNVPVAVYQNDIGPLPVELTSFIASVSDGDIILNWQSATEVNNYGFEIERKDTPLPPSVDFPSREGKERSDRGVWETLGFVEGNGNSNSTKKYSFIDKDITYGSYLYRLKQIDIDGSFSYSKEITVETRSGESLPTEFELYQNYPNPFNPTTTIKYTIPADVKAPCMASLRVYDILGNQVATLVNEQKEPGFYEVKFEASQFACGVYFCELRAGEEYLAVKKMLLLK